MNPEIKAKWLARLRDPEAKQCKNTLRQGDTFCCLGLLTDIYISEDPENRKWLDDMETLGGIRYSFEGYRALLPICVAQWADLDCDKNYLISGTCELPKPVSINGISANSLVSLNDNGVPFTQIADVIEAQF